MKIGFKLYTKRMNEKIGSKENAGVKNDFNME